MQQQRHATEALAGALYRVPLNAAAHKATPGTSSLALSRSMNGGIVVVGSDQQSYVVPMAEDLGHVLGASERGSNAAIYSPPLRPPTPASSAADYSYIDEDAPSQGLEVEYSSVLTEGVADGVQQQQQRQQVLLDEDGYVEGGEIRCPAIYTEAAPAVGGGNGQAVARLPEDGSHA